MTVAYPPQRRDVMPTVDSRVAYLDYLSQWPQFYKQFGRFETTACFFV